MQLHGGDDDDFREIIDVHDATQLWRLLVTRTGSEMPPAVAVEAFQRLHGDGQPGAFDSALLICTDWRWRRVSAPVLAGVLQTGLLGDPDRDRLAEEFLWQARVRFEHQLGWLGESFVEFEVDPLSRRAPRRREVHIDPRTLVVTERHVWPPLRSWSAMRLLARRRVEPVEVLSRARKLPPADAAAVATGAVHAAGELEAAAARVLLDAALRWSHKAPRLAAMKHLAVHGETARAQILAAEDRDASIRKWGLTLVAGAGEPGHLF